MKTRKIILAIFLALSLPIFATAQIKGAKVSSIDVNMSSDTLVVGDIFNVIITINDNKGAGKSGIEKTEIKTLIPILESAGIDVKKDLKINDFHSYYEKKETVATIRYSLKVRSVKVLNEITSKLTKADILIYVESVDVSNEKDIKIALRDKALKASYTQANSLLSSVNCKTGRIISIRFRGEDGNLHRDIMVGRYGSRLANSSQGSSIDQFKKVPLNSNIDVTYEIISK